MKRNGVLDAQGREITYARISLTDACNFACPYCRPALLPAVPSSQLLTVTAWLAVLEVLHELGISSLRLTGGEPLLYPQLYPLLQALQQRQWFSDIALTTNGSMLAAEVPQLRQSGVQRLNISLDAVSEPAFSQRTGRPHQLASVLAGIEAAVHGGFQSVKINTVLSESPNDDEVAQWLSYMERWQIPWRFIEYMPFQGAAYRGPTLAEWQEQLARVAGGPLMPVGNVCGQGPATYYSLPNGCVVGFIFPLSAPYCASCNRIRITAEGAIRLCLLRDTELSLAAYLQEGHTVAEAVAWVTDVLQGREAAHAGTEMAIPKRGMWKIGG